MPRALLETTQFKKDKKRIKSSGRYDWEKMREIVAKLMSDLPLEVKHRATRLLANTQVYESATLALIGCSFTMQLVMWKRAN